MNKPLRMLVVDAVPLGTAAMTSLHLRRIGLRVMPTLDVAARHDAVVVGAPRGFGCITRYRSACAAVLRRATTPVVVAARQPRPLHHCAVILSGASSTAEKLPSWLDVFQTLGVHVVDDLPILALGPAGGCTPPQVLDARMPGYRGTWRAELIAQRCRERFVGAEVQTSTNPWMNDVIVSAVREAGSDVVVLAEGKALPGFWRLLELCVSTLNVAAIVLPRESHGENLAIAPVA